MERSGVQSTLEATLLALWMGDAGVPHKDNRGPKPEKMSKFIYLYGHSYGNGQIALLFICRERSNLEPPTFTKAHWMIVVHNETPTVLLFVKSAVGLSDIDWCRRVILIRTEALDQNIRSPTVASCPQ